MFYPVVASCIVIENKGTLPVARCSVVVEPKTTPKIFFFNSHFSSHKLPQYRVLALKVQDSFFPEEVLSFSMPMTLPVLVDDCYSKDVPVFPHHS
jgi:hypothetical protein